MADQLKEEAVFESHVKADLCALACAYDCIVLFSSILLNKDALPHVYEIQTTHYGIGIELINNLLKERMQTLY